MKYKITYILYIAAVSISFSLSGTSENQTFDDNRQNDLINVRETEWTIHRNWLHILGTQDTRRRQTQDNY